MNSDRHEGPSNIDRSGSTPHEARHAHAAHCTYEKSRASAPPARPAIGSAAVSPEVVARLELLDDAVFEAVKGSPEALEKLRSLWPTIKSDLGDALLAESREQYMRHALTYWQEHSRGNALQDATRACDALEVLSILFEPGLM